MKANLSKPQNQVKTDATETDGAVVLVVDDDLGMRCILRHLLEQEGLQVIEAADGHEALALYNDYAPDLVLLDAVMPIMDGFTCCRQLHKSRQPFPVPILMVTTLDDEQSIKRAFESGAIDYATKPINRVVLQQRVHRLIQQSRLMKQVQQMNEDLDRYAQTLNVAIRERTSELERSLEFESSLKYISDRVRDSLDEEKILQAVVKELACALDLFRCNVAIYDSEHRVAHVRYEYIASGSCYQNRDIHMDAYPEIYQQLLQGKSVQFCPLTQPSEGNQYALFAFPIDTGEIKGDIWLMSFADRILDDLEIRLVQQVTNQCVIALRQSRLYQSSQAQVQELERLNQLKDDFLSTVSHELRSPITNMKIATHMLEISLNRLGILSDESNSMKRYFKVLREEEQRELNLINDLLDLTRLDADAERIELTDIDLHAYLPKLADAFRERMQQQKQRFVLQIPTHLPALNTDLPSLERMLTELLHNACKYTPAGETITMSAQVTPNAMTVCVSNTGVEIVATECDRVFDKFYRIPNNDPWKHGGTGLGLTLVKKLIERLGGQIHIKSGAGQTTFILEFRVS